MSLALRTASSTSPRARPLAALWRAARGALRRIGRAAALRREIERMDDRTLSDLGLSRAQLEFEADRRS